MISAGVKASDALYGVQGPLGGARVKTPECGVYNANWTHST